MSEVLTLEAPPVRFSEIYRYARCPEPDPATRELVSSLLGEVSPSLTFRVCFTRVPVAREGVSRLPQLMPGSCDLLTRVLENAKEALIFGATVGLSIDRFLLQYGKTSPARAQLLQAIGAERIESLCDSFVDRYARDRLSDSEVLLPRVSPGYGDFPLSCQSAVFELLDLSRKIGLTLNSSFLMTPSKSVTAVAGISLCPQAGERTFS